MAISWPKNDKLLVSSLGQLHRLSDFLQVPRTSELYVHRSGRTARAANEGLSLLLIGPDDLINFRKIYKTLEKSEELPFFPVETKYMTSIKVKKHQSLCSLSSCLLACLHYCIAHHILSRFQMNFTLQDLDLKNYILSF